jgi:thioredoxin reductase (NADPH)
MEKADYDLVIAGGGPAGLTAGLYAARARLNTLLIEKMAPGGQAATTFLIENYPGFPEGISGFDFAQALELQAKKFGLIIANGEVNHLRRDGKLWEIGHEANRLRAKAIIIATGVEPKKLGIPGEEELKGKGVSYCATCDGPFFTNEEIGVVGGGDSAVDEAIYLTRFARKVYLIHRRNAFRAAKISQERAFRNEKIEILWDSVVEKIHGEKSVEGVTLKNVKTGEKREIHLKGLFMYVGWVPNTGFLRGLVSLDSQGFVTTNDQMATSQPGIFAAGDVRVKLLRQVATAIGDGATAAFAAEHYIQSMGE